MTKKFRWNNILGFIISILFSVVFLTGEAQAKGGSPTVLIVPGQCTGGVGSDASAILNKSNNLWHFAITVGGKEVDGQWLINFTHQSPIANFSYEKTLSPFPGSVFGLDTGPGEKGMMVTFSAVATSLTTGEECTARVSFKA
jgi:hypothetical protein